MEKKILKISVVIPVYKSSQSLQLLTERLMKLQEEEGYLLEVIFVDDASPDTSWDELNKLKDRFPKELKIAQFLVNMGQHNAILYGFSMVSGDYVITMDDDLQNPPEEIPKLIAALEMGYDLVIAAYEEKKHTPLRNVGGGVIDQVQRWIFKLPRDFQLTSFRGIRKPVVTQALQMAGAFPYITSMLLANTSNYRNVSVRHDPREFGSSNYNMKRSVSLALNLIFHYSSYPLYALVAICLFSFVLSVLFGLWVTVQSISAGAFAQGWASTIVAITFFSSLNLFSFVVLGFYVSRFHQQLSNLRAAYKIRDIRE